MLPEQKSFPLSFKNIHEKIYDKRCLDSNLFWLAADRIFQGQILGVL